MIGDVERADGGFALTGEQSRVLRTIQAQSAAGRWTASAMFSRGVVEVLKGRGLIVGELKLYTTKLGRELAWMPRFDDLVPLLSWRLSILPYATAMGLSESLSCEGLRRESVPPALDRVLTKFRKLTQTNRRRACERFIRRGAQVSA